MREESKKRTSDLNRLFLNPLLVKKCTGIAPTSIDNRPKDAKSHWDSMKDQYKKENPNIKMMGDNNIMKKPSKSYDIPLPE